MIRIAGSGRFLAVLLLLLSGALQPLSAASGKTCARGGGAPAAERVLLDSGERVEIDSTGSAAHPHLHDHAPGPADAGGASVPCPAALPAGSIGVPTAAPLGAAISASDQIAATLRPDALFRPPRPS